VARLTALLLFAAVSAAQQPAPQEPPEEDELSKPKEYTFNPLQAEKELKVGKFYSKKNSWRAASARFLEATRWDPNLSEAWRRLGEAKEKLKDEPGAADAYAKYVELAPDAKDAPELRKRVKELRDVARQPATSPEKP
jgi:tetratricopeptide (TPR) repeat protein